jgi:hypothetical protein
VSSALKAGERRRTLIGKQVGPVRRKPASWKSWSRNPEGKTDGNRQTPATVKCSLEGFHGPCPDHVSSPKQTLTLSRLSASFVWPIPLARNRQSRPFRAGRSSNRIPSG